MSEYLHPDYLLTERLDIQVNGRVMIDPIAFRLFEPNCTYNLTVHKRIDKCMLSEEQYMIARPIMLGFCFGVKKWGLFVY